MTRSCGQALRWSAFVAPLAIASASLLAETQSVEFVEAPQRDFPREEKNLRKWDAPVVADLDQDGFVDLVLNDHGLGARIVWNNQGRFAKPYDLIMGDMHGITVGDFDLDGNLELLISRGGGAGKNARNAKLFRVDHDRQFTELPNFKIPLAYMRGRTLKFFDGDHDGDLDLLNFAFPSEERQGRSENYVYENDGAGQLVHFTELPAVKRDGQKTLLTDFNGDAHVDLVMYGEGPVQLHQGLGDLNFKSVTEAVLPRPIEDVTSVVEFDYDNDGDFDLFLTRGKEFSAGETFYDPDTRTWGFFTKRGPFRFEDLVVGDILKIENYQAQWPHKTLHIGESAYEYEFPGETHSGRDIRLVNSDALGWPDELSEKGSYLGYVGNEAWRLAGDIWSPTTGVVHGVKDYVTGEHPAGLRDVLLENRDGKFVDVTEQVGLKGQEHTTGAAVADFDNNGYPDLLVVRRGDLVYANESLVYLNQGNGRFKRATGHGVISPELGAIGMGAVAFDYDRDGAVDILMGNERGKWHLFRNQTPRGSGANYIVVDIEAARPDGVTSLGASVSITADGAKQVHRVGATGAAYSRSFNPYVHFGLGAYEGPIEMMVTWTDGTVAKQSIREVNLMVPLSKSNVTSPDGGLE